jgi:hypothetical protein
LGRSDESLPRRVMPDESVPLLQLVSRMACEHEYGPLTDGHLLERFVRHGDEGAFAALVYRHAGTIWRVCRCALRDPHEVEDACQATFLILVRKICPTGKGMTSTETSGCSRSCGTCPRSIASPSSFAISKDGLTRRRIATSDGQLAL